MDRDPTSLTTDDQRRMGELISEVRALQAWKQQQWRQTCRDRFLKEGDACTAFFFQRFKKRKARTTIKKMLADGGRLLTSKEEIKTELHMHYSSLYGPGDFQRSAPEATRALLENVQMRISGPEKELLDEVPAEKEIFDSLRLLPSGKSPGPDGITKEIFHTGLQVVGRNQSTRYLGASLTTLWRGVDNGRELLLKVAKKAESYSRPLLSFEARTVALKHAVFAPLVYHLLSAKFKAGTLKKADSILRDYVWSKDETGRKKKALASAFKNPQQSLWLPLFFSAFLKANPLHAMEGLCHSVVPAKFKQCPVASLLAEAWDCFLSLYRWRPGEVVLDADKDIKNGCFLVARKFGGTQDAAEVATRFHTWAASIGEFSLLRFLRLIRAGQPPTATGENTLVLAVREELKGLSVQTQSLAFNPTDWVDADGNAFNSSLRASQVYLKLAASKELAQVSRFNTKWGVTWDLQQWRQVWDTLNHKALGGRHRCFLWRVLSKAFFDGRKEMYMNLPSFACDYCRSGVEDTPHIFMFCPRWRTLWQELGTKLDGWDEACTLISSGASVPQLIAWAGRGRKSHA
ncbi:hypothetical protein R1sor_015086 [Riccia sorocarpa]|uniref:Reverse transcriptase zinc-binding domain-containing protein n=1 Tax=Riccia sorocarpa TaxID=122646 RepID=A0ABD3HDX6_9MARC